ncbi:hypothetical protein HK102_007049, partial [Quaeritorhiza haematococci]
MTTTTCTWTQLVPQNDSSNTPLGRSSHSANILNNTLYIFSGENVPRQPIDANIHPFDLTSSKWLTPIPAPSSSSNDADAAPTPRVGHGSATVGNKIYIWGGRSGADMSPLSDLYAFDTLTNTWSRIPQHGSIPPARSYFSITASDTHIYVFGGCPEKGRLNDLYAFDTTTDEWTKLTPQDESKPAPGPRGGAGLAYLDGKLYIHGGFNMVELSDTWSFDLTSHTWTQLTPATTSSSSSAVASVPEGRSVHGLVAVKERGVIVSLYGERDPSPGGHVGAGKYHDDV